MNDKKPVLVILTPGFPADENDCTCLPARQAFILSLKKNYPLLKIIVLSFQYPYSREKYNWHGIEVIGFNGRNKGKLSRLFVWRNVWKQLLQVKKQYSIMGLLSFWMGECSFIGRRFSKRYHLKFYAWILGQDARKGNKYFGLINPGPSHLIALSDFISHEFDKNYGIRPANIIPVAIDTSNFDNDITIRDIDILGAGSLIPLKRYDLFIDGIKKITTTFPGLRAMICGQGEEKEKLEKLIDELRVRDNINMTGEIAHRAVIHFMQRAKIFLHTSSYEGFGSVCAEALYAGCHVISFCRPMDENIRHWHIVHSEEEMIKKILEILKDEETEYDPVLFYAAENAAASVMKLFAD